MEHEAQPPYENGKLTKTYEMITKDKEGEAHRHQMHVFEYDTPQGDESHFLSQASPTIINSAEIAPRRSKELLLADIPDIHYGLRKLDNGTLRPTHRPEVMDGFLQVMKREQPNIIVIGGDAIDLPEISKYDLDSNDFNDTMQLCIDGLHKYFSRLRSDNPNADIIHLKGNHENRFNKFMIRNAMPLFGVKPANMPESWAVNSYPFLLRLDELGFNYTDNYKINDRLTTMHGEIAKSGATAAIYLGRYATSMMFHHDHRRGYGRRVFPNGTAIEAFGFGCQADVTGSVPGVHSRIDDRGHVVENYENWSNGGGFVEFQKGDKPFRQYSVPIEAQDNYEIKYNGKTFKARQDVVEALRTGK